MGLYLDTSCLLKLVFPERDSARVAALVSVEERVVVSTLAQLELRVQIQGRVDGGTLTARAATALMALVDRTLGQLPYEISETPCNLYSVASAQITPLGRSVHCRTLDRLHLAAMEALGLRRLLTSDETQARAALAQGFEVLRPRA
jgi:predicted nucleic acid-binding protein